MSIPILLISNKTLSFKTLYMINWSYYYSLNNIILFDIRKVVLTYFLAKGWDEYRPKHCLSLTKTTRMSCLWPSPIDNDSAYTRVNGLGSCWRGGEIMSTPLCCCQTTFHLHINTIVFNINIQRRNDGKNKRCEKQQRSMLCISWDFYSFPDMKVKMWDWRLKIEASR